MGREERGREGSEEVRLCVLRALAQFFASSIYEEDKYLALFPLVLHCPV